LLLGINLINMELALPLLNLLTMNLPLENESATRFVVGPG